MNIIIAMLGSAALKAQDVLVACKLYSLTEVVRSASNWTYKGLSSELGISLSEAYNSLERCRQAQLIVTVRDKKVVSKRHFYELLAVAVPRIFYAVRGGLEVGLPTSVHASSLRDRFERGSDAIPTVWPCDSTVCRVDCEDEDARPDPRVGDPRVGSKTLGDPRVRGESISPIYSSVPEAAVKDPLLYELLALVDVIRIGDTRSRNVAAMILEKKILGKGAQSLVDAS